ncbi:MAG: viroplasmin family protein [Hominenteromicrobium sp.]
MAKKYYAVRVGRQTGIFETWEDCRAQTTGFKGASFKSFPSRAEAEAYLQGTDDLTKKSAETDPDTAVAYVDGSYHAGTHAFSCGAVLFLNGEELHFSQKFTDAQLAEMRNVAGEIKGAETVMTYCMEHGVPSVTIFHDYEGVAKWATGEWKANKPGTAAYRAFCAKAAEKLRFRFVKVKGHSGDKYNDLADRLAKDALGIN